MVHELATQASAAVDTPKSPHFSRCEARLRFLCHGRLTLLGDAAHAMPPFFAQRVAQAIEDAEALAQVLAGIDAAGVPRALQR